MSEIEQNIDETKMEIPSTIIVKLIEWLKMQGYTPKEILDCILYICSSGEM